MMSQSVMTHKLKAFAISLTIFVFFAVLLGAWVKYVLYEDYFFWLDGGIDGLKLVWSVDFVLGPLLALIVFHPRKGRRELLTDVVLVGVIQFSAMAWGAYMVWSQRPVAVVFNGDQFMSLTPGMVTEQGASMADLKSKSSEMPSYFFRRDPKSPDEAQRVARLAFRTGVPASQQVALLEPVTSAASPAFALNNRVERYVENNMKEAWREWSSQHESQTPADYRFALFMGRYGNAVLVFHQDLKLAGYLQLPWGLMPTLPMAAPRSWDAK
jgi:hypothetical protein